MRGGTRRAEYPDALSKGFVVGRVVHTAEGWFLEPLTHADAD